MRRTIVFSIFLLTAIIARSYDAKIDGIFYDLDTETKEAKVTFRSSLYDRDWYVGKIVIPQSVSYQDITYRVTGIERRAFFSCSNVTSISIPPSIANIGAEAFQDCHGLTAVNIEDLSAWCNISFETFASNPLNCGSALYLEGEELIEIQIPEGIGSIGSYAFYGYSKLVSVRIPNGVSSISRGAFSFCSNLAAIELPSSLASIGDEAFVWCSSLTKVELLSGLTIIGKEAFGGCSNLTSISFPEGIEYIGENAFEACNNLKAITIPESVAYLGNRAFYSCPNLEEVTLNSNSIASIPYSQFNNLNHIFGNQVREYTIGNQVTQIGSFAFSGNNNLSAATISEGVTYIGEGAFSGCTKLTTIEIPESVERIGKDAFGRTAWYESQDDGLVYAGNVAYKCKGTIPNGTSATIKEGTLSISPEAFYECQGLASISIPEGVLSIGEYAFRGCSTLVSVLLPNSLLSIGQQAFQGCAALSDLSIPQSVESIGDGCFTDCKELASIYIASDYILSTDYTPEKSLKDLFGNQVTDYYLESTIKRIGSNAFYGCALASIKIPDGIQSIGNNAFAECENLEKVIIKDLASWCKLSFDGVNSNPLFFAGHLYSDENTEVVNLVIPSKAGRIGNFAFHSCSNIASLTIEEGVENIGDAAFYECTDLTATSLPQSITSIGHHAFFKCSNLESITIPSKVSAIGDYAFGGCTALSSIKVEEENAVYDSRESCNSIIETASNTLLQGCQSSVIPFSVTAISYLAFLDCTRLTSIILPANIASIGMVAFDGCTNLTAIYCFNPIPPTIDASTFNNVPKEKVTLFVPESTLDAYKASKYWAMFPNMVGMTDEEVRSLDKTISNHSGIANIYGLDGKIKSASNKGIQIVRQQDGKTKKIMKQ